MYLVQQMQGVVELAGKPAVGFLGGIAWQTGQSSVGFLEACMLKKRLERTIGYAAVCCLQVCRLLNFCLNPRSLSMGKVCPRSHISSSFEILSLWLSGAVCISSFMSVGSTSVTFWTPEAYVPSAALGDTVWPACLDFSIHCLVTESKTYSTPSLWVTGLFLNCWKIFWTMMESDCSERMVQYTVGRTKA